MSDPTKSTRRKQWTLLSIIYRQIWVGGVVHNRVYVVFVDRTQNRYNRFGTFLAEDGWPDSQVDLAKQLLHEDCGKITVQQNR